MKQEETGDNQEHNTGDSSLEQNNRKDVFEEMHHALVASKKRVLFVTGRAGTGKSTLLRKLVSGSVRNCVVLAPTGAAAVEVGGQTIHSFFRFKPGVTTEQAWELGRKSRSIIYRKLELLVIDEISMVRADLLDCISVFLQASRKNDAPFGGVQVVFFGDLYQLEPVVTKDEATALGLRYASPYFFSADVFQQILRTTREQQIEFVELTTIYRQSDETFIAVLDKIRRNAMEREDFEYLNQQYDEFLDFERDYAVYLTDTNHLAQRINNQNLARLEGDPVRYTGRTIGDFNARTLPAEMELELKVGARVMLVNNDQFKRWVNGTLATVRELDEDRIIVEVDGGGTYSIDRVVWGNYKFIYDDLNGQISKEEKGSYEQYPLRLAWAMTIHKSQGKTFDEVVVLLQGKAFAHGQLYVALSRSRTKDGIRLNREIQPDDIRFDPRVDSFMALLKRYRSFWTYPIQQKIADVKKAEQNKRNVLLQLINEDGTEQRVLVHHPSIVDEQAPVRELTLRCKQESGKDEDIHIPLRTILSLEIQ